MGYFRFLLALLVAFSHVKGVHLPLNLGVSAVVAFYFLSGYLMSASYQGFQRQAQSPLKAFFVDRFIRIFPAYWLVFLVALPVMSLTGREWMRWETVYEFALLPYHVTFILGSPRVLVPAWSLSAEMVFYLLVPVFAFLSSRLLVVVLIVLMAGQFAVFTVSGKMFDVLFNHSMEACQAATTRTFCSWRAADLLGYRWMPFSAVYFVLGTVVHRYKSHGFHIMVGFVAISLAMLVVSEGQGWLKNGYVDEQLWGAVLLLPIAWFVIDQMKALNDPLDQFLGRMSYPMFLTHWVAFYVMMAFAPRSVQGIGIILIGFVTAYVVALFQTRVDQLRYSVRGFGKLTSAPAPA